MGLNFTLRKQYGNYVKVLLSSWRLGLIHELEQYNQLGEEHNKKYHLKLLPSIEKKVSSGEILKLPKAAQGKGTKIVVNSFRQNVRPIRVSTSIGLLKE